MNKPTNFLPWLLLAVLSLIWGSSFILIKRGLEVFSANEVGALRIFFAGLFLVPFAVSFLKKINRKHYPVLFIVGLVGSFLPAFLFAKAQTNLESSVTGVLNALTPMFTMLIGLIGYQQKAKNIQMIGLLLGFLGSVFLIIKGNSGFSINYYALYVVLATIMYGLNLNIIKYKLVEVNPFAITSISLLFVLPIASVYLFGFSNFLHKVQYVEQAKTSLFYLFILGVLGTAIALILFNKMVKLTSPVFASSVTYIIPIVAVCWGFWGGEELLNQHFLGIFLILSGLYLTSKK